VITPVGQVPVRYWKCPRVTVAPGTGGAHDHAEFGPHGSAIPADVSNGAAAGISGDGCGVVFRPSRV